MEAVANLNVMIRRERALKGSQVMDSPLTFLTLPSQIVPIWVSALKHLSNLEPPRQLGIGQYRR